MSVWECHSDSGKYYRCSLFTSCHKWLPSALGLAWLRSGFHRTFLLGNISGGARTGQGRAGKWESDLPPSLPVFGDILELQLPAWPQAQSNHGVILQFIKRCISQHQPHCNNPTQSSLYQPVWALSWCLYDMWLGCFSIVTHNGVIMSWSDKH